MLLSRVLLDPQGGEGDGGNTDGGNGNVPPPQGGRVPSEERVTVAAGLLARNGNDPLRVISKLLKENGGYRDEIRDLNSRLPGEGSVVLTKDDAGLFELYKSLGPDPGRIADALKVGNEAVSKLAGIERDTTYARAAEAAGYNAALFKRLAAQDGITVVTEEVAEGGRKVGKAFVVGEKGARTPLAEYAKDHWADLLPALGSGLRVQRRAGTPARANDAAPPPTLRGPYEQDHVDVVTGAIGGDRYSF